MVFLNAFKKIFFNLGSKTTSFDWKKGSKVKIKCPNVKPCAASVCQLCPWIQYSSTILFHYLKPTSYTHSLQGKSTKFSNQNQIYGSKACKLPLFALWNMKTFIQTTSALNITLYTSWSTVMYVCSDNAVMLKVIKEVDQDCYLSSFSCAGLWWRSSQVGKARLRSTRWPLCRPVPTWCPAQYVDSLSPYHLTMRINTAEELLPFSNRYISSLRS